MTLLSYRCDRRQRRRLVEAVKALSPLWSSVGRPEATWALLLAMSIFFMTTVVLNILEQNFRSSLSWTSQWVSSSLTGLGLVGGQSIFSDCMMLPCQHGAKISSKCFQQLVESMFWRMRAVVKAKWSKMFTCKTQGRLCTRTFRAQLNRTFFKLFNAHGQLFSV